MYVFTCCCTFLAWISADKYCIYISILLGLVKKPIADYFWNEVPKFRHYNKKTVTTNFEFFKYRFYFSLKYFVFDPFSF